jgi:hypothetical protein
MHQAAALCAALERMKMNPMLGCSSEDDEPPLHIYEE